MTVHEYLVVIFIISFIYDTCEITLLILYLLSIEILYVQLFS